MLVDANTKRVICTAYIYNDTLNVFSAQMKLKSSLFLQGPIAVEQAGPQKNYSTASTFLKSATILNT